MADLESFLLCGPLKDPELAASITAQTAQSTLAAQPARCADTGQSGTLVRVSSANAERLRFYAAVHGAEPLISPVRQQDGTETPAQVLALSGRALAGQTFADPLPAPWIKIWRAAVDEIMSYMGKHSAQTVQAQLWMVWARADSRVRGAAAAPAPLGGLDHHNIRIASIDRPYAKFFAVEDYVYSHDRFDGTDSGPLERAVFVGADAVTVLPYDPVRDRVLLIEQVRAAPLARSDPSPWLIEVVAGRIEPGDSPEITAHREALEEAGVHLSALHSVGSYYPTSAAVSEYIYSYVGIADLPDTAAGLGGLDSEAEDIKGHLMSRETMMDRIASGQFRVGPLLICAYWLELNHMRLRQSG